jgi:hypothetical protein
MRLGRLKPGLGLREQGWMIAFQRQNIVRLLPRNLLGNRALSPHCINTENTTDQSQLFEQDRNCRDFIRP